MPDDGYVNPDRKPYSGRYNWVPSTIPTASDTAGLGWLSLVHERGTFRNDYFVSSSVSTNYTLYPTFNSGVGITSYGNPAWPINKAFRRKQNPTPLVPPSPDTPFWVKSNTFHWQADFNAVATKLSAITLEYSLLVDAQDPRLLDIVENLSYYGKEDDYQKLLSYQTGQTSNLDIDWSKYVFAKIKLFTSTDTEDTAQSFPLQFFNLVATTTDRTIYSSPKNFEEEDEIIVERSLPQQDFLYVSPSEYTLDYDKNTITFKSQQPSDTSVRLTLNKTPLVATGYFVNNRDSSTETRTVTISFDYDSSNFKDITKIRIESYYTDGPIVKLALNKILFFRVAANTRPNISNTQLPCRILAYAFNINCNKTIPGLNDYYPNNNNNPTFYVKMFHPEDVIKSRGFAHAIDLRFFIPSFPIFSFNGITLVGSITDANYWVVFVGPLPSKKSVIYYFTGQPISGNSISGRLVRVNDNEIENNKTIYIQKINSDSKPSDTDSWSTIYTILNTSNLNFPEEEFKAPWLFYDSTGTSRSWYRFILVDLNTAVSSTTPPVKGLIYSEKSTLKLETTGVSNVDISAIRRSVTLLEDVDPLDLEPLAFFTVDNIEDLLGSNILFRKGQWKLNLRAKSNDSYNQTNTHVFMRMWFHPGEEVIDFNNPHQYRSQNTEIIFEKYNTDPSNIADPKPSHKVKIGLPSSLDNLIVSPPLSNEYNTFEILRYADGLIKDSGTNNVFASPFASPTTKLVVAFYNYSVLQNSTSEFDLIYNPPTVDIELDPITSSFETCILQNSTGTLAASRYYLFDRTNYVHFNTDASDSLKLTRNLYEGGIVGTGNSYLPYNKKIQRIDSIENPTGDSRIGLITFESGVGSFSNPNTLVCIEHTNYSLYDDKSVLFYADFTTKDSSFQDGRVNASTWIISFQLNTSTDTIRIPSTYKIMAFFVDRYGIVTERIFTSPYLKLSSNTGSVGVLNYTATISQPFFITGTDAQLIVRLIAYPRSANNEILTESELNTIKENLQGNPIGTRIKNFYLTIDSDTPGSSGLTKLNIVDAGGFSGSTRFYEDLDLVPSSALDSQQFWFYASDETLKAQIIENGKDFSITGALYSPTWFVNLPKGMEVNIVGGATFNSTFPYGLRIRTVLDESFSKSLEDVIKAAEDNLEKSIHIVANGIPEDSETPKVINYLKQNDPFNVVAQTGLVAGQLNGSRAILSGQDPIIFNLNSETVGDLNSIIGLLTEIEGNDGNSGNLSFNSDGGTLDYWIGPNSNLDDNQFTSSLRLVAEKMSKFDVKFWDSDDTLYLLGIVSPGGLMLRVTNPYNAGIDGNVSPGLNLLVDGPLDIADSIDYIDEYIIYSQNLSGSLVLETRPSLVIDTEGNILVAYVVEGLANQIIAKRISSGLEESSEAFSIVDMSFGSVASNETAVFCPVLAYDEILEITYCLFWCAGKLFFTKLTNNGFGNSYIIGAIYLVAGNRDLSTGDNPAHNQLRNLVDSNYLIIDQEGQLENDIHRQSAGFFISKNEDHASELFVYYKTSNDTSSDIYVRKIYNNGNVTERIKVS